MSIQTFLGVPVTNADELRTVAHYQFADASLLIRQQLLFQLAELLELSNEIRTQRGRLFVPHASTRSQELVNAAGQLVIALEREIEAIESCFRAAEALCADHEANSALIDPLTARTQTKMAEIDQTVKLLQDLLTEFAVRNIVE